MTQTTITIKINESVSDSGLKMIKEVIESSARYKVESIEGVE